MHLEIAGHTRTRSAGRAGMMETTDLLDAQCWLWGQDLKSPVGNLLVAWGSVRDVQPGDGGHRTYYRGALGHERTAVAWSGGLVVTDPIRSLYLSRVRFLAIPLPGLDPTDPPPILRTVPLEAGVPVGQCRTDPLFRVATEWLVAYESFVHDYAGPRWRAACAERWDEVELEAHRLAAEVGVRYEPLPPIPREGLSALWRAASELLTAPA